MRAAVVEGGVVVNIIEVESLATFPGLIDAAGGTIGDTWDGEKFTSPPPIPEPVPSAVAMRQARLALLSVGILDDVEIAIGNLPSPQKEAARIEWEYSNEVQRYNGFVAQLGPALGMSSEQLDALFIAAGKL